MSIEPRNLMNNDLRQRALKLLQGDYELSDISVSNDLPQLLQELRIFQVELQLQNDELRHAQSELESARQKYFDYYELAPVGYLTLNNKGTIIEANLTARDMIREDKRRLTGKPLSMFVAHDCKQAFYDYLQHLLRGEKPPLITIRLTTQDGRSPYVTLDGKPFVLPDGERGLLITLSDVTALRETEAALQRAEMERARMGLLTHFIRSASHEFRTPLAILQSSIELTHRKGDFAFFESRYSRLLDQIDKMERILELMLISSRLYLQPNLNLATQKILPLCESVLQDLHDNIATYQKQVSLDVPDDLWVYADEEMFHRAVYELVHNALRHSGDAPQVRIIASAAEGGVTLRVENDGEGIPPALRERIFEGFQRGDEAHSSEGLGLGLSLVKQIMELHGGTVTLDDSQQVVTFTLFFPTPAPKLID